MAGKKAGRPKIILDATEVEKLAAIQCSLTEMAAFFSVSEDTLERNYADVIAKGREKGKMSLRHKQFDVAMKGSYVMLIWLGKQWLNQHDKADFDIQSGLTVIMGKDLENI
jgi:hypothetical protein